MSIGFKIGELRMNDIMRIFEPKFIAKMGRLVSVAINNVASCLVFAHV